MAVQADPAGQCDSRGASFLFNISSYVPRRAWADSPSLEALALGRKPVILTDVPLILQWPALTVWSDLCSRAPYLGRVFRGQSRVFYHDNRKKPFASFVPSSRESVNMTCDEFVLSAHYLYVASPLPGDGTDDRARLLADLPGVEQLTIREASTQPASINLWAGRAVVAEAHYDGGRNMVAMLKGAKRYILSPPKDCERLSIIRDKAHPSYRHSTADWSNMDAEVRRDFSEVSAVDTILRQGEVLYIPSFWFHYIISLDYSIQCNSRSGSPPGGEGAHDIESCMSGGGGEDKKKRARPSRPRE